MSHTEDKQFATLATISWNNTFSQFYIQFYIIVEEAHVFEDND